MRRSCRCFAAAAQHPADRRAQLLVLSMRTAKPTTRPPLSFQQFGSQSLDVLAPRFCFLRPEHPADPLIAGKRREVARALSPQLAALLTSLPTVFSTSAVNFFRAKDDGQRSPSSRFAAGTKPNVAYLDLNFCAAWKKQMILPSFAYAGIPYHVFGERVGALALTMAWSRLAMTRSDPDISAILARTSLSPSASPERARLRSSTVSFIAARSSSVSTLAPLPLVLRVDFLVLLMTVFLVCSLLL